MTDEVTETVTEVSVPREPLSIREAAHRYRALKESQDQPETPEAPPAEEAEDQPETESEAEEPEQAAEAAEAVSDQEEEDASDADAQGGASEESEDTVEVNGEQITQAELRDGYMRASDYTKKTQELAERERGFNEATSAVVADWQQRLAAADQLAERLKAEVEAKTPDYWGKLSQEDPIRYAEERAEHDRREGVVREHAQWRAQEQQRALGAFKEDQDLKLKSKWGEFFDPVKGPQIKAAERAYLKTVGFSDQEIDMLDGPMDHRQRLVIRDALKAHALETAKPVAEKKATAPKVIKSKGSAQKADRKTESVVAARKGLRKAIRGGSKQDQLAAGVDLLRAKRGRSGTTSRYT